MGKFEDVVELAKQTFIPKGIGLDYLAETPAVQSLSRAALLATPGIPLAAAAAQALADTETGRNVLSSRPVREAGRLFRDLIEGLPPGEDDLLFAGLKALKSSPDLLKSLSKIGPESMAVVTPLIKDLGIIKPRGAAYVPGTHHFESKLAEHLDKKFIAPGNPEDLISLKEVRSELGKLPGTGVKKEELSNFNLGPQIDAMISSGKSKITREELATLIDKRMPRVEIATDTEKHKYYTLPDEDLESKVYDAPDYKSYIMYAPPAKVPERTISRVTDPVSKEALDAKTASLIKLQEDYDAGKISSTDLYVKSREIENAFQESQGRYIGSVEPFKDIHGETAGLHYDQEKYPNILGWTRTTRRRFGPSDAPETAKYIEEIQSDWATKGGKKNPFPLHDVNDVLMRYIDRISRQAGEQAVGWTPPSVQIARWGGSKAIKDQGLGTDSFSNTTQYIGSLGGEALKPLEKIPKGAINQFESIIKGLPSFEKYKEFASGPAGELLFDWKKLRDSRWDWGVDGELAKLRFFEEEAGVPLTESQVKEWAKRRPDLMEKAEEYALSQWKKSEVDYERNMDLLKSRYLQMYPGTVDANKGLTGLLTEKTNLVFDVESDLKRKLRSSPIEHEVAENYTGFEDVYGRKMPKSASQIIKQRGGTEVFNERVVGDPESNVARRYSQEWPKSKGYVQPQNTGSFFYRIPKEQRGKSLPYPDSLWGLFGAAGLAALAGGGKKQETTQ